MFRRRNLPQSVETDTTKRINVQTCEKRLLYAHGLGLWDQKQTLVRQKFNEYQIHILQNRLKVDFCNCKQISDIKLASL